MSNLQEDVGGSPHYSTNHASSIMEMIPEVSKGGSRMDIRNMLTQILPHLNKLQSDSRFDAKVSNPMEFLNHLEPSVLSPLVEVIKCFQEENGGRAGAVSGGGTSNGGGGGGWNNLDLSCDTNHWRDGPIDIKPTEEPLASPQASLPPPFKSPANFESDTSNNTIKGGLMKNRQSGSGYSGPLSPAAIRERMMRNQFQGQQFGHDAGLLNGTRNHSTNTLPQMSPPMDFTSSTLNGLGSVSAPFNSQQNTSQLEPPSKTYQELTSHQPYRRELQLDVQELNSNHTSSSIQEFSPVKRNSRQESDQGNPPFDVFCLDNSIPPTDEDVGDDREGFHPDHMTSPKDIKIKTENDDLSEYVTSSGRNRGLGKANEPRFCCQVCGDVAAGFHCGAYVCEACKKFYLRCLKNGGSVAYTCPKTQECVISKETRSHCQYCRYQKCLALGMYKPGRDDSKHLRVDFKSIPCKVCAAPSSGFHFGAITCEGCKGFFRRMVKEKLHKKFVCTAGGSCDVASSNRTACKACRYQKCVEIGMALEGTRLGRQSNSIKRSTLIKYMNSGLDVALFPKLGEEEREEAHHKVDKLIRGSLPESASSHTPHIQGLLKIKEESETDESYGKCMQEEESPFHRSLPNPPPPVLLASDSSPRLECSSQETSGSDIHPSSDHNNKSYLQIDSNRIVQAPCTTASSDACVERRASMACDFPTLGGSSKNSSYNKDSSSDILGKDPKNAVYVWKDDEDELPSYPFSMTTKPSRRLLSGNAKDYMGKRTYSTDTESTLSPTSAKCPKRGDNQSPVNEDTQEEEAVGPEEEEDEDKNMISAKESKELLLHVIRAFKELENITTRKREPLSMEKPPCNEKSAAWWAAYESFMHHAKYTLRFVKKIPGFRELDMSDQITLVRESVYPITLLIHGRLYQPNLKREGWFCNTEEEKRKIHHFFPKFKELENHLTYTGRLFREMDLSLEEFAFLSAIMVFTIDSFLVRDSQAIQIIQGKLTDSFFDFCTEIETHPNRPGILLLRLAELKRANFEHTQIAIETQRANPDVDFSQLWHEMFLSKVNY